VGAVTRRVEVLKDQCISSGRCVADAPAAFAFDADELAEPLPGAGELDRRQLLDVARNCPGEAIIVYEDDVPVALE
jgi:ferredoxin